MKKIRLKHEEDKRKKRNHVILGIFLIFIMFGSVIGFIIPFGINGGGVSVNEETEMQKFNGFEFTEQNGFWILNLNGINLIFRYNPSEIFDLNSRLNPLLDYEAKPLYVYSENVNAKSEIKANMFSFVEGIEDACPEGMENCESPVRTCENNFIIIRESESRDLRQEMNCVFIEGNNEDLTRLTDEFLYKIFGVA